MKKRIDFIDVAKGIAIILVVIGHLPRDIMRENNILINFIYQWIYIFHMPLFFFLSGYLTKKYINKNKSKYITNKVKKMLIPWIFYNIIIYLIMYIADMFPLVHNMFQGTGQELIGGKNI